MKKFFLTDQILSETICLFCALFTAKNWSDLCKFYSKVIFLGGGRWGGGGSGILVCENIF